MVGALSLKQTPQSFAVLTGMHKHAQTHEIILYSCEYLSSGIITPKSLNNDAFMLQIMMFCLSKRTMLR